MGRTGRSKGGLSATPQHQHQQQTAAKQETVSMAHLEKTRPERHQAKMEASSSCADCIKERSKTSDPCRRKRKKVTRARLNSPIIVRLQDTIKVSVKNRWKASPKSSEPESEEFSSDDSGSSSSSFKLRNASSASSPRSRSGKSTGLSKPSNLVSAKWPASLASMKDDKHFNAFLSAIERVHQKEKGTPLPWQNLEEYVRLASDKPASVFLNNSVNCQGSLGDKEQSRASLRHSLQLVSGSDNIDLICNDLSSKSSGVESDEPSEDLERSEQSSVISSSEESLPESDLSCSASSESLVEDELCSEELSNLTEYTTGLPLTRYDCPPLECPECLAYFAYAPYASSNFYHVDRIDSNEASASTATRFAEDQPYVDAVHEAPCEVTVTGKGKVTVSVANLFSRSKRSKKKTFYWNSVYLDLTDTDISLSIQYHPETTSTGNENQHQAQVSGDWTYCWHPAWAQQGGWMMPYYMPYYMMMPMAWMPYMNPYPWIFTNPKPICVPRNLRCLNSQRLCMVPAHEIKSFTASQPPQRPWIPLTHPERNRPSAIFTVMCYNVLCDKYATRQLYGYCPSWALNWEYRKKGIIEEIRHYSADIITLQEVETEQFYNFFQPELKRDGYDGIFSPKSRARTMTESDRKHVDGCAIFFRTAKFSLIKEHLIEFNQLAMASADGSHDMINRVMTKDNIGLSALLECKESIWDNGLPAESQIRQPLLVSTCHIHWDPEFCDVKLIQTMMLMSELKNIIEESQTSFRPGSTVPDCNGIPLILCGDLNSLPESGVLEYLMSGKVNANHEDFKNMGDDPALVKLSNSDTKEVFTHGFKLSQAYNKSIMPYTNYTFDFKGIIDYIFSSREHMRPLGLLGPLEADWFTESKVLGCPHPHIPSDHLPLLVELEMHPVTQSSTSRGGPSVNLHMGARR